MKKVTSSEARANLPAILAGVLSRQEPVELASQWGPVTVIPEGYLDAWTGLAKEIVALVDGVKNHVDAAEHTDRWDRISLLRDTDTGSWWIRAGNESFVVDLDQRILSMPVPGVASARSRCEPLVELGTCQLGENASWTVESNREGKPKTSSSPVTSITRLDAGLAADTHSRQSDRGGRDGTGKDALGVPTHIDHRRTVTVAYATHHLQDLVADVASRLDRVIVTSTSGAAMFISTSEFVAMGDLAHAALEIIDPVFRPPDAKAARDVGEDVVELRDEDSGAWLVTTSAVQYVVSLQERTVRLVPFGSDMASSRGQRRPLTRLINCRVEEPLAFTVEGWDLAAEQGTIGSVRAITRLDDWLFG